MLTAVTFVLMWGNYITLGNVLTPLFKDQYTPSQISIIGLIFVVTGVIGCYLMGLFIDKTQKHLWAIRFITASLAALYTGGIFIIPIGILGVTGVLGFFLGMFNVPILPSAYAYSVKLTNNMPPAVVNGLMMSAAQVYAFCASLLTTYLFQFGQMQGLAFFAITLTCASICTFFIDEEKHRRKYLDPNSDVLLESSKAEKARASVV